jgi:hypothetical protein
MCVHPDPTTFPIPRSGEARLILPSAHPINSLALFLVGFFHRRGAEGAEDAEIFS